MMKRAAILFLAAGILLGNAAVSEAGELKAGGRWDFYFGWMDQALADHDGQDSFYAAQRIRPEFRFVTDSNLQAVIQLEIGPGNFGNGAWGMGGDSSSAIKFRYGYLDWAIPDANLKLRIGMQNIVLPQYSISYFVGPDDCAGASLGWGLSDRFSLNAFWARPLNNSVDEVHDAVDIIALSGTYKGDGFAFSPYAAAAAVGENADFSKAGSNKAHLSHGLLPVTAINSASSRPDNGTAWWLGVGGQISLADPLRIGVDAAYGSIDMGTDAGGNDLKRAGWVVSALATYKLDRMTPGLALWYASGDDGNVSNGSERMPAFYWDAKGIGTLGFDTGFYSANKFGKGFAGTWGVQARLDSIQLAEKLKLDLRTAYIRGTNNKNMGGEIVRLGKASAADVKTIEGQNYLTDQDDTWLFNCDFNYSIYKNLNMNLSLAYMKFNFDSGVWGSFRGDEERMYSAAVRLTYRF